MVDVLNEGFTIHKVFAMRKEIHPQTGKEISKRVFTKDYVFKPGETVKVPKEDFDKMINKHDHTKGRIYSAEQWNSRITLIERQDKLREELESEEAMHDAALQTRIRKKMNLDDEERYLILNNLPHEVAG
jgi:hypothetical protein